jgi:hypothetical protein
LQQRNIVHSDTVNVTHVVFQIKTPHLQSHKDIFIAIGYVTDERASYHMADIHPDTEGRYNHQCQTPATNTTTAIAESKEHIC